MLPNFYFSTRYLIIGTTFEFNNNNRSIQIETQAEMKCVCFSDYSAPHCCLTSYLAIRHSNLLLGTSTSSLLKDLNCSPLLSQCLFISAIFRFSNCLCVIYKIFLSTLTVEIFTKPMLVRIIESSWASFNWARQAGGPEKFCFSLIFLFIFCFIVSDYQDY